MWFFPTLALTTGADVSGVMTGSAGTTNTDNNDTFTATQDTYTTNDVIVGGNGTDTLNITATGAVGNASSVVGVENINVTVNGMFSGASYNAGGVAGTVALGLSTTQVGGDGAFAVTNLGSGTTTVTAASNVTGALSLTSAGVATQTLVIAANSASAQNVTLQGSGTTDTASVTANGAVTLDTDGVGGNAVETVTLAGNTAAATYTLGTIATSPNFVLSGAQNVTVSGTSANFTGKTVTDSTTAGTTTVKVTATTSGNDLSKVSSDVIDVSTVTAGGDDLIFKATGANVTVSATANRLDLISTSTTDTATTDSITILATGATTLIGNATGGAGGAAGTAGAYETVNYSATVANAAVNTATLTLGAGTALNLSGSNAITLATTSTAKSINAAALSGALIVNYDGTADITTVTGGSANDTFAFVSAPSAAVTIDGGAGTADKVTFGDANIDASTLTLSNIELINLDAGTAGTRVIDFKASQLSGKSYIVTGVGAANDTVEINAANSIDTTTIDLSKLVIDSATVGSITVLGTAKTADFGSNAALTITGSSIKDIITGDAGADVISAGAGADEIIGGAGNDTITGGEGADTITGGAGNDVIDLTETTAAIDTVVFSLVAGNGADTITGFNATNDVINVELLAGGNVAGETAIAAGAATTDLTTAYVAVFADGSNGTGGVKITNYTDLTVATTDSVVAFLAASLTEAATETYVAVINDLAGGKAYVYNVTVDTVTTVAGTIEAGDVTLVGTITTTGALTTANTDFTA